jgi:hypothetical protein
MTMIALLAALSLELAPLHLEPRFRTTSHVALDEPQGEVCPPACDWMVRPGEVHLLYQAWDTEQPVPFALDLPARGATVQFSNPPFREPLMILGGASAFEGALFFGIGAAANDSGWRGLGIATAGIGALEIVVALIMPRERPPVQAHDADGAPLPLRF